MKKTLIISLALLFSVGITACNTKPADNDTDNSPDTSSESDSDHKRYGVKEGSIVFELTGSQTGTKTITWKNWGMIERTENDSSISASGLNIPNKDISIMKGKYMYNYTPGEKDGSKIINSITGELIENSNSKDLEELGLKMMKAMGGKKTGTDTIAGKTCDIYEIENLGTTTCIWKGLNLKNESSLAGITISEIANSISTDSPDDSLFELPSDVTFKDLGDIGDIMKNL